MIPILKSRIIDNIELICNIKDIFNNVGLINFFTLSKCIQHQHQSTSVLYLLLDTLDLYHCEKRQILNIITESLRKI